MFNCPLPSVSVNDRKHKFLVKFLSLRTWYAVFVQSAPSNVLHVCCWFGLVQFHLCVCVYVCVCVCVCACVVLPWKVNKVVCVKGKSVLRCSIERVPRSGCCGCSEQRGHDTARSQSPPRGRWRSPRLPPAPASNISPSGCRKTPCIYDTTYSGGTRAETTNYNFSTRLIFCTSSSFTANVVKLYTWEI